MLTLDLRSTLFLVVLAIVCHERRSGVNCELVNQAESKHLCIDEICARARAASEVAQSSAPGRRILPDR